MIRIVAAMRAYITGPAGTVRAAAVLTYTDSNPWAVTLDLAHENTLVTWSFARELLNAGLHRPSGCGDVAIWPCPRSDLGIVLHSDQGVALVEMSHTKIARFLRRTYAAVPAGSEQMDMDQVITALLAEATS